MRFDTAQVLEAANISKETLRHWKLVLRPIRGRDGRSKGYTFQELLTLAVIARAVHDLSVPISRFRGFDEYLFEHIASQLIPGGAPMILCITPREILFAAADQLPEAESMAIVRVQPILNALRQAVGIEPTTPNTQLNLPLDGARIIGFRRRATGL